MADTNSRREFAERMIRAHNALQSQIELSLYTAISWMTGRAYTPEQVRQDLEPLLKEDGSNILDAVNAVLRKYNLPEYQLSETPAKS